MEEGQSCALPDSSIANARNMPAVNIYRPPAARLSQEAQEEEVTPKSSTRTRRPDIQVYVPRPRRFTTDTTTNPQSPPTSPPEVTPPPPKTSRHRNSSPNIVTPRKKSHKPSELVKKEQCVLATGNRTASSESDISTCDYNVDESILANHMRDNGQTEKKNKRNSTEITPDIKNNQENSYPSDDSKYAPYFVRSQNDISEEKTECKNENSLKNEIYSPYFVKSTNCLSTVSDISENKPREEEIIQNIPENRLSLNLEDRIESKRKSQDLDSSPETLSVIKSRSQNLETTVIAEPETIILKSQNENHHHHHKEKSSSDNNLGRKSAVLKISSATGSIKEKSPEIKETVISEEKKKVKRIKSKNSDKVQKPTENSPSSSNDEWVADKWVDTEKYAPKKLDTKKSSPPTNLSIDDCTWDVLFDENGDCLEPSIMEELTKQVGKVRVQHPTTNYSAYETAREVLLSERDHQHVLEIYGFPSEFKTQDLMAVLTPLAGRAGLDLKWVDDTHALAVFSNSSIAAEVLALRHPMIQTRPLSQASAESKQKARRSGDYLQPYRPRPETCTAMAKRLVSSALGVKLHTSKEEREKERTMLREAREKKRLAAKQSEEAWEGKIGGK